MLALQLKDLYKTYQKMDHNTKQTPNWVVNEVNLAVGPGDFYALLGPNGAGKSTIVSMIAGLTQPSRGRIEVFGVPATEAKLDLGLVPQEFNFNQFETVQDIVVNQAGYYGISRKQALERAEHYLKQLDLWAKRDQPSRRLSGGMKRRLMIVRALIHQPKLLLLDEPTVGIDVELRRNTWQFLKQLNQAGMTIILTTHYLEEVEQLCNYAAFINKGKIIANDSINDLLTRYFQTQPQLWVINWQSGCYINDITPELELNDFINIVKTKLQVTSTELMVQKINHQEMELLTHPTVKISLIIKALNDLGIEITNIQNKACSIEEMFLQLIKE